MADGRPCPTAKKLRKLFKAGKLGRTVKKAGFPKATKRMILAKARKKGYTGKQSGSTARVSADGWWDGFINALDCVAPGAEASCKRDLSKVKALKEPTRVALACGGTAVIAFYSGGAATAVGSAGLGCFWLRALDVW